MQPTDKNRFKSPTELLETGDDNEWLQRGLAISRSESTLRAVWQEAAGDTASHSQLNHIDHDSEVEPVAVVFADSASWASHIRVSATRLLQRVNEQLSRTGSQTTVGSIRVRVTPHQPDYEERN